VVVPKFPPQVAARSRFVSVVGEAKSAEQINKGEGVDAEEREIGACFSDGAMSSDGDSESPSDGPGHPRPREWSASQGWQVNLWPRSKENQSAGVTAVHRERLVQESGESGESGKATLESIDAWVDPVTRGVRLIARASLPLVQVGSAIGGAKVYAARDERPSGARYVHYVVVRPPASGQRLGGMAAMRQDGNSAHGNGCGHLRMPLAVATNDGDTAVVMVPVELPAAPKAKGEERAARVNDAREPEAVEREIRTRDMQIHVGVSQSSRDKEPLLAVSFGWATREQVQRVADASAVRPVD
jgi:hypothetical protein